ncbi:MAG TPA: hypothetical protein VNH63_11555, partial [Gemmatimonadales bacterium]|nr:hypothetical protein [Gemmatimonadales bacterium]
MRSWVDAIVAAGVVPASYIPESSLGRPDEDVVPAELVEGDALLAYALPDGAVTPTPVCFLDGIQHWKVVGHAGATPVVRAHVAGAVRRRGADRRLRTAAERSRELAITHLAALPAPARRALEQSGVDVVDLPASDLGQPARLLRAARVRVDRAREAVERELAEECVAGLGPHEWLVVDGLLSDSARLAEHPRTLGVIKSHGTQFFSGADLELALTLPAAHRSGVFLPQSHQHQRVYSWYLRLWPWAGNDLLYGLLRIEARAHTDTLAAAGAISAWLVRERAPVSTPDARFDRLLYP